MLGIVHLINVVISSTVFCETQILEDGTLLEDFIVVNKGHMGYPTILMYIEQLTISECADTCRRHLRCVTFNYNWNTRACELVDQIFDEFEADVDKSEWYNYGTPSKIDGGWSNWFEGSTCSATCGYGFQTQYRTCTAPEPKYGGAPCIGNEVKTVSCKIVSCPIDGGLSDWVNDGKCTVTCGGGVLNQMKTCTNPAPQHGGQQCTEQPIRTVACNKQKCPIDGGLSDWVNDGKCTVTCGGGTLNQMKTCTNPAPQHGGKQCTEQPRRTVACNKQKCPIDGGLSDWVNDGKCSVTCGGGVLNQMKTCTNPAPQHGGKQCTEQPRRTTACNKQKCPPRKYNLSDGVNDGQCSVTCGGACEETVVGSCCKFPNRYGENKCFFMAGIFTCDDIHGVWRKCRRQNW